MNRTMRVPILAGPRHHRRRRQLTAAHETLTALGITDVPLAAIAKGPDRDAGRETFFLPGREPFRLKPRDPLLYFVERLRDEAHRFAVGSHRARRKKDIRESGLQEIPGVGPARKRALLQHFGTLKAIERASPTDLATVPGLSAETARKIYDFFRAMPDDHRSGGSCQWQNGCLKRGPIAPTSEAGQRSMGTGLFRSV